VDLSSSFQSLVLSHRRPDFPGYSAAKHFFRHPRQPVTRTRKSNAAKLVVDGIGRSLRLAVITFAYHGKSDEEKGEISFDDSLFEEQTESASAHCALPADWLIGRLLMEQPKSSPVIATWDFCLDLVLLEAPLCDSGLESQAYETCRWSQVYLDADQDRYFEVRQADF
jgi:hypothetical protein